jgi:hypothetical protein
MILHVVIFNVDAQIVIWGFFFFLIFLKYHSGQVLDQDPLI